MKRKDIRPGCEPRDPETLPAHLRHYCIECNADVEDRDDTYCTQCSYTLFADQFVPVEQASGNDDE